MDFALLYEKYAHEVHRFALFLSGNETLADDITAAIAGILWIAFFVTLYRGRRNVLIRLR